MVKPIMLKSAEDIDKLYRFASSYDGDIYVSTHSTILNARSVLGLISLVGAKGLKVVFPDHANPEKSIKAINELEKVLDAE